MGTDLAGTHADMPSEPFDDDASEELGHVLYVARGAIDAARKTIVQSVNESMVEAYWIIGKELAEKAGDRAQYGTQLIASLSRKLTAEYGKGYSVSNLRSMRQFYRAFPIRHTVSSELSWSHYRIIMQLDDPAARQFYVRECAAANWSVRELKRQVDTHLFERLLHTQEARALKDLPNAEKAQTVLAQVGGIEGAQTDYVMSPFKDPFVFEFLDIPAKRSVLETDLESALIDSLQDFILELGRGFAFVKRQRRLSTDGQDWWADLVFYNIYLRRHVLFDLKTGRLDSRDVGQMDFYLSFFDDKYKVAGDEPSIGILLCSEKNAVVAKYSALARNENLMAAQYFTYLPTEEELETVLRRNRAEFEERMARELPEPKTEEDE